MARSKKDEFAPGTKVGVRHGGKVRRAVILEDRGILAGHRLVHIRLGDDPTDQDRSEWEVPADELEPLPAAARRKVT